MRHLVGFILAIALGAALFFGAGWGFTHLTGLSAQGSGLTSPTGLIAWSALAATGLHIRGERRNGLGVEDAGDGGHVRRTPWSVGPARRRRR